MENNNDDFPVILTKCTKSRLHKLNGLTYLELKEKYENINIFYTFGDLKRRFFYKKME